MTYECTYRVKITLNAEIEIEASDSASADDVARGDAMEKRIRDEIKKQLAAYGPVKVEMELTDVVEI